jgi:hypothetical protein
MEITRSLADFLGHRLICVQFTDGRIVHGVFGGLMLNGSVIINEVSTVNTGKLTAMPKKYSQEEIKRITICDDYQTAHLLNLAIKHSKKVRETLKQWLAR